MPGQPTFVTCDPSNNTASPDPVPVSGQNVVLKFKLKDTNLYKWGSPAITIDNGGIQFTAPSLGNDGAISVTDSNTDSVKYTYSFSAVLKASGKAVSVDPAIQNGAANTT